MSNAKSTAPDSDSIKLVLAMITPVISFDMEVAKIAGDIANSEIRSVEDIQKILNSFILVSSLLTKMASVGYKHEPLELSPNDIIQKVAIITEGYGG